MKTIIFCLFILLMVGFLSCETAKTSDGTKAMEDHTHPSAQPSILNTDGEEGIITRFDSLDWYNPMEGAPIQFATVSGKTFEQAHVTYGKFPAGFITPKHIHSHSYQAVVISGTMINPMSTDKGEPVEMPPGSYWYVPGGQEHITGCISEEPCIFHMYQQVAFDFTSTEHTD